MKRCLIVQPFGIGDVIFTQKIASFVVDKGYEVLWPLGPGLSYIKDYIKTEGVRFLSSKDPVGDEPLEILNLKEADIIESNVEDIPRHLHAGMGIKPEWKHVKWKRPGASCMKAKYELAGLDFSDWADFVKLKRNKKKENELKKHLNLPEKFCFLNRNFGTPPNVERMEFFVDTKLPIVEMEIVEGYNLFDWCGVLCDADEIFTVETALNYIIDILPIKTTKLEQYSKHRPPSYFHVEGLFKTKWHYNGAEDYNWREGAY